MRPRAEQTVFALASGAGRAGIAVVRLSGPDSAAVCGLLTGGPPPPARTVALRAVRDPASGEVIDRGLVLWFAAPASYTGEDVLELHVHGGPAVLAALFDALGAMAGLRPAEPGEFSRRAFVNGRMDLTQAEAIADLVAAETRQQLRQARRQMDGALGRLYQHWHQTLLTALARTEAEIDFAPEEEVPDDLMAAVLPMVAAVRAELRGHLADDGRGERLRQGLSVAVIGPPNSGKSSFINKIARNDIAIVTAVPGTTRDVLQVPLDLDGYPLTLYDTAGLRRSDDPVEAEGVRRARRRAASADLRLAIFDGLTWPTLDRRTCALIDDRTIVAVNKADAVDLPAEIEVGGRAAIALSCHSGQGMETVVDRLTECARAAMTIGDAPCLTRARHRAALGEVEGALARIQVLGATPELALVAEELRLAMQALGRITGLVGVEDILEKIFGEFCIGK